MVHPVAVVLTDAATLAGSRQAIAPESDGAAAAPSTSPDSSPPPVEIYSLITSFLSDPETAYHCALSCRSLNQAVRRNEELWRNLAAARWRIAPVPPAGVGATGTLSTAPAAAPPPGSPLHCCYYRGEYERRHALDATVVGYVGTLAFALRDAAVTVQNLQADAWHWGAKRRGWVGLVELLAVRHHAVEALEGLQRLALADAGADAGSQSGSSSSIHRRRRRRHSNFVLNQIDSVRRSGGGSSSLILDDQDSERLSAMVQCLAFHVLDAVYFFRVHREWRTFLRQHQDYSTIEKLETGVILLAQSLVDYEELLACDDNRAYDLDVYVREQLDSYSARLRARLLQEYGVSFSDLEAVQALIVILVNEQGFTGNGDDFYNACNSSIAYALQCRKGIPITLAVLYKLILHRLNVTAHVVGLPGHVVLGLADGATFFDVFDGGRRMSVQDCVELVSGLPWSNAFIEPLGPTGILTRILHNIQNCFHHELPKRRLVRTAIQLERSQLFLDSAVVAHRQVSTEAILTLDPAIFVRCNLIQNTLLPKVKGSARAGSDGRSR